MAKNSREIIHADGAWEIRRPNTKGDLVTKDTIPDVEPMGDMESILVFCGLIKEETNARRASLSLLCHIWMFGTAAEQKIKLKQYVGKGDKKTGQLSSGLKDDFKLAEDLYFKQYMDENHPDHKAYVAQLPKLNERSEELAEEDRHSYFLTRTRKSPSYANAKNLFLSYLAFVGHEPFTVEDESGELIGIEPPEVMRERVAEAKKDVPKPDNSWEKRMQELIRELVNPDDPTKPLTLDGKRLPGLIQDLKTCMGELQRRLKHYEKQEADLKAIHEKYHGTDEQKSDVVGASESMIDKAQKSAKVNVKLGKEPSPAPAPEEKVQEVKQEQ
jgi:hypothetical protein